MRRLKRALGRRVGREEGQVIVVMVLFLVVLCGFAGFVVDVGRVYVAQRQLQQAVDAAALAAAQDLPTTATANSDVTSYSALPGNLNAKSGMTASTPAVTFRCLTSTGLTCQSGTGQCRCNAISVSETANVNTTFLGVLGIKSFTSVSSTATASMHGGTPHPLDVAVVLDTTASMNSTCSNTVTGITSGQQTKLDCAKSGVQALLTSLDPCNPTLSTCGSVSSGNVANALDEVSLFTFPGVTTPTAFTHDTTNSYTNNALELGCPGGYAGATTPTWFKSTSGTDQNEIQVITRTGTSNFTLTYSGQTTTTPTLTKTASAANVQTALLNLSNIGPTDLAVTGSAGGPYTVTFGGTLAYQNVPTISGTNGTVSVSVSQNGSSMFPNWFLNSDDISYPSSSNSSYQIVPLSSDYRASDTASTLTSSSKLVDAVTWATCPGATWPGNEYYGLNAPGGAGTYIAYSINAAQAALSADSSRHATPVMIVLSDGDASTQPSGSTNPCNEAIQAAATAKAAGTEIYSIAYDSNNVVGQSCTQDASSENLTGWVTMQDIASDSSKFYCDDPPSGQTCTNASAASLAAIFAAIGIDVTNARLLPDSTS